MFANNDVRFFNELIGFFSGQGYAVLALSANYLPWANKVHSDEVLCVYADAGDFHYEIVKRPKGDILTYPIFFKDGEPLEFRVCICLDFSRQEIYKFPTADEIRFVDLTKQPIKVP